MSTPVFVFGSNLAGRHGKGAAHWARRHRGAIYGQGIGAAGSRLRDPHQGSRAARATAGRHPRPCRRLPRLRVPPGGAALRGHANRVRSGGLSPGPDRPEVRRRTSKRHPAGGLPRGASRVDMEKPMMTREALRAALARMESRLADSRHNLAFAESAALSPPHEPMDRRRRGGVPPRSRRAAGDRRPRSRPAAAQDRPAGSRGRGAAPKIRGERAAAISALLMTRCRRRRSRVREGLGIS